MSSFLEAPKDQSIKMLRENGWEGFHRIGSFSPPYRNIPDVKGVYLVLCPSSQCPKILPKSTGGWFKGKDPTVSGTQLSERWVDETSVLYIGKAGGSGASTLRRRLRSYLKFGNGQAVGHWGGRYIWQLSNSADLALCWKQMPHGDPEQEEVQLLTTFFTRFGKLPFANLKIG